MTTAQYVPTFVNAYNGKAVNFDGVPGDTGQCVQLVATFCRNLGLPVMYANAVDWYNKYVGSVLQSHFDRIPKSAGLPRAGDIAVWGASSLINSPYFGHIDIVVGGVNTGGFVGFDSNWGGVRTIQGYPAAHEVQHTYLDVLGFLRQKVSAPAPVKQPVYYNVVRGDNVSSICARFHITEATFAKLNPTITNLNLIFVGERVRVA